MHTLNPEITLPFYQFHAQKALFKVTQICNIIFWIENDLTPPFKALELFQKFIRFYIVTRPLSTYQECLIDKGDISSFSIRAKVTKSVGDETIEVIE